MINEDQDKIDFSEYEDVGDELLAEAKGAIGVTLPEDMNPLHKKLIYAIDWFSNWQGKIACVLVVPIICAMVYEVIARKFFIAPTLWAFDISRMLYGMSFMLGAAYALMRGLHIRADFLYRGFSERLQGRVDLVLYIGLFMPAMLFFLYAAFFYFDKSIGTWISANWNQTMLNMGLVSEETVGNLRIRNWESAGDSTWAPYVWPVKLSLMLGILFLCIQGISEILKAWYAATRGKWPV
jgi:TRAP-type mannitol/chloroaromatic compound transport system permease small subunit